MNPSAKHIHVVCHDVPYPVDHGGIFDLFYTLKTLHELGWDITLHCFEYGRGKQETLTSFCSKVHYYKRSIRYWLTHLNRPYIVGSRMNEQLAIKLLQDNAPILLQGTHVSWIALDERFKDRCKVVRMMNIETLYYEQLAISTHSILKKIYFSIEAHLLRKYERKLSEVCTLITLSEQDQHYLAHTWKAPSVHFVPVCIPFEHIKATTGNGYYCLYHGNLSVPENEQAAIWLLKHIFNDITIPLVIAGKNPSAVLEKLAHEQLHTCLVADPDDLQMQDMIEKAQLHILPSLNKTGVKLKLINALFNGRHCLVNQAAVEASALAPLCIIANNEEAIKQEIQQFFQVAFTEEAQLKRKAVLEHNFNNQKNIENILTFLYSHCQ